MPSDLSVLGFGLLLGVRHALDADHVAAVSVIAAQRRGVRESSLVGAVWGAGHAAALLAAGVVVLLLRVELSERTAPVLELLVAGMLVVLGADALRNAWRGRLVPAGAPRRRPGVRPLVVGMLHGLAGSAGLMLLVLSSIASPLLGLVYLGVFGLGSIGGMVAVSAALALPLHLARRRFAAAVPALQAAAGLGSVALGLAMAYEICFGRGLV